MFELEFLERYSAAASVLWKARSFYTDLSRSRLANTPRLPFKKKEPELSDIERKAGNRLRGPKSPGLVSVEYTNYF